MIKIQGTNKIHVANEKEKTILLKIDMDGVVTNWVKGCCETCGLDPENKKLRNEIKSGKDMQDIEMNSLTEEEMWDKILEIGSSWWENLDVLPWANKLIKMLSKHGEVAFLSSPGNLNQHPRSVAEASKGKMEWIYKHFKEIPVILCHAKYLCASPNSILIDDSQKKIDKFVEYGGKAFLWPNQYKLMDGDIDVEETLKELEEQIEKMK